MKESEKVSCYYIEPPERGLELDTHDIQVFQINNTFMIWKETRKLRFLGRSIVILLIILIIVEVINASS